MPELAEVEITRRKLLPRLRGRRILDFWTDWPRGLKASNPKQVRKDLIRRGITDVKRHGKVLFLELSGNPERILALHFRMSGRLEFVPSKMHIYSRSRRYVKSCQRGWVHFTWRLSGGNELRFVDPRKFGIVWYGRPEEILRDPYLAHLGPDPHTLNLPGFLRILRKGRGMIKPFLLRQDKFSGVGNIIADESLWRAKIHPRDRIEDLTLAQVRRLHRGICKTITVMLSSGGTTMRNWGQPDGELGKYYERRAVYARVGESCRRCGKSLVKIKVAGRGTTICPRCQRTRT